VRFAQESAKVVVMDWAKDDGIEQQSGAIVVVSPANTLVGRALWLFSGWVQGSSPPRIIEEIRIECHRTVPHR